MHIGSSLSCLDRVISPSVFLVNFSLVNCVVPREAEIPCNVISVADVYVNEIASS